MHPPDVTTARMLAAWCALMILGAAFDVCQHFDGWRVGVVAVSVMAFLLALSYCRKPPRDLADDLCSLDRRKPCAPSSRS